MALTREEKTQLAIRLALDALANGHLRQTRLVLLELLGDLGGKTQAVDDAWVAEEGLRNLCERLALDAVATGNMMAYKKFVEEMLKTRPSPLESGD